MTPATFNSRVSTVEAVQISDNNVSDVIVWTKGLAYRNGRRLMLRNGSGLSPLEVGDWLVRIPPRAPILKMSDAKFRALYEPVEVEIVT